jgi:hypothetical protein
MTKLSKRHAEALLNHYDEDPVAALEAALRVVLARGDIDLGDCDWAQLVAAAPLHHEFRLALLARETAALDRLARELNEVRSL